MNFIVRRIIHSLVIAVLCGVFVIAYEDVLPRNPIEDGPLDWLILSVMVAAIVTPAAWLLILLPISCLFPRRSKLASYMLSIPIGGAVGVVFAIAFDLLISLGFNPSRSDTFSSSYLLNFPLPGLLCGALCAAAFSYLERRAEARS